MTPDRLGRTSGGLFIAATGLALIAVHFVLLALLFNRWTIRWLAPVLLCITASAAYFMGRYHVYIDPSMLRNVLATDVGEARDLMSWSLLPYLLLLGILPGFPCGKQTATAQNVQGIVVERRLHPYGFRNHRSATVFFSGY